MRGDCVGFPKKRFRGGMVLGLQSAGTRCKIPIANAVHFTAAPETVVGTPIANAVHFATAPEPFFATDSEPGCCGKIMLSYYLSTRRTALILMVNHTKCIPTFLVDFMELSDHQTSRQRGRQTDHPVVDDPYDDTPTMIQTRSLLRTP